MREDDLFTVRIQLSMTHDMTDFDISCVVVGVLRTSRYRRAREVHTLRQVRQYRPNRCTTLQSVQGPIPYFLDCRLAILELFPGPLLLRWLPAAALVRSPLLCF